MPVSVVVVVGLHPSRVHLSEPFRRTSGHKDDLKRSISRSRYPGHLPRCTRRQSPRWVLTEDLLRVWLCHADVCILKFTYTRSRDFLNCLLPHLGFTGQNRRGENSKWHGGSFMFVFSQSRINTLWSRFDGTWCPKRSD